MQLAEYRGLVSAASGTTFSDLLLYNLQIADLVCNTFRKGLVLIEKGMIVALAYRDEFPELSEEEFTSIYKAQEARDMQGNYLLPGFIDAHMHIESSHISPDEYARLALLHGTTTVLADAHEIANVAGAAGLRYMIQCAELSPLDIQFMLPSCVPALPDEQAGATLGVEEMKQLLSEYDFYGIGEMMNFPGVCSADSESLEKVLLASQTSSGRCDGHAPLLEGAALNAYVCSGIFADHESSTLREALAKLSRGMVLMMREGSCSHDLPILKELLLKQPHLVSRVCLCTDDRSPTEGFERGFIDNALALLIEAGVDLFVALCSATLSPASLLGFDHTELFERRGLIAPGRRADLLVYEELNFRRRPKEVFVRGKQCVKDYKLCIPSLRENMDKPVGVHPPEVASQFDKLKVAEEGLKQSLCAPKLDASIFSFEPAVGQYAIDMSMGSLITGAHRLELEDLGCADLLRLLCVERHGRLQGLERAGVRLQDLIGKHIGQGFALGYPLKKGALASSVGHDSHNIVVIGSDPQDMLLAYEELGQGGITLVADNRLLAKLDLPIAGLLSDKPFEDFTVEEQSFMEALKTCGLGATDKFDPLMALMFLPLPVIPELRITPRGIFDVRSFSYLNV